MADFSIFFRANAHRLQQAKLYWPRPPRPSDNPLWPDAKFRALIVRLSSFRDVDRSTPHLFLADAVRRSTPDAFVDFAFFPPARDRALLQEHSVPWLTGIFSQRSADEFDVVLISNAYTLELLNLPALLLGSGIPPWAHDRAGRWPPFILGGSNAMAAQAIVGTNAESFVDAIFFGEGEEQVAQIVRRLCSGGREAPPTNTASIGAPAHPVISDDMAREIPGLWLTGRWPELPVQKAMVRRPVAELLPLRAPVLNSGEAGTARLQINYGCPAFCTFCLEGYDRKPYREISAAALLAAAHELKRSSGAEALELFSFNFNTHGELLALLPELNRLFDRVNMMSQRVDLLATSSDLLPAELAAGKRSFTLGIEGLSTRLRAMLHKSLPTADIIRALQRLLRENIRELKFFYLLTGDETADDFAEFTGFCRELQQLCRQGHPGLRVLFSFGLLIRMPFTPLRHDRLRFDEAAWQPLLSAARGAVRSAGFEFRLAMTWPEYAVTQMLALAPYGLAPALLELARDGFCFDQTLPAEIEQRLRTWMHTHDLWTAAWLAEKPQDYPFAFDFVRSNVAPTFLFRQYQAARQELDAGYCLGGACLGCGTCATPTDRKRQTRHRLQGPTERDGLKKFGMLMETKARLKPRYGRFQLAPELAGTTPEWLNACVLRELLAALPDQTENLLNVRESLFTVGENAMRWPAFSGETLFALKAWDLPLLLAALGAGPREITPGIRWLGGVEKFEPGVFRSVDMELQLPMKFFPDAENAFQTWLKTRRVAFSLRRTERSLRLQLDPKKKSFLSAADLEPQADGMLCHLTAGPAFDPGDFFATLGGVALARQAGVCIRRVELR